MDVLQHSVFDYCYMLIDAQASMFHTHVPQFWMDIWADILQSFLVIENDAISYIFQDGVFSGQDCQQDRINQSENLCGVYGTCRGYCSSIGRGFCSLCVNICAGEWIIREGDSCFCGIDLVDLILGILDIAFKGWFFWVMNAESILVKSEILRYLRNLWWLFELLSNMGFIGLNCLDCSNSLLSDFYSGDAANLLMECDLCNDRLISANCCLEFWRDICDAFLSGG